MARNWSAANKGAVDLGLFGNELFGNSTSPKSQILDEGEAKLVAECLNLEGLVTSQHSSLPKEGSFPVASIKLEAVEDEDWPPTSSSQPQAERLENANDLCQVSSATPEVEESKLPLVPKAERDALDDEIDAWLNWRPSGKILLTDSDKKRQKNRMRLGLKSSDVEVLLRICKGCKRCDLACLKSGLTTRLRNTSSKLLLRKNEGGLQGATRRLSRRSLRGQADHKSGIGHIGISRPRTRSQLTNLKGKVDFLEQTSLENSSIKVLRSRSFFLPKVSKEGEKPKLKARSTGLAKTATENELSSQQGKSPAPRRKSRSQIWLTKRRRAKQRKTLTTGHAESANASRTESARKTRVKASRWDDFIRRQREAFQQFQGDGSSVSTDVSTSSSGGGNIKPTESQGSAKTRAERNLFDQLKGKPSTEKFAAASKKNKPAEKQIKEVKAVLKTRAGSKLGKLPASDGDSYMDSELSSVQTEEKPLRRGRTASAKNVKETAAKALPKTKESTDTTATVQNSNTNKTSTFLKAGPSGANTAVLQVTPKLGQGGALSVPLSSGRMPLYIPINYQGRTLLCPVIPASGDSLKYAMVKTCTESSAVTSPTLASSCKTETAARTNTVNTTPTLIVSPTVMSSSSQVAQSTVGTTAASSGAKKNVFTIALQPQGGQAKLKTILPMPGDSQGQVFPQIVLLKQPPISNTGKDSRNVVSVSSVVLNGKSSVVLAKGNSLVESSTKATETQSDVTTTCASPMKSPLGSSGKPMTSTQTSPSTSLVSLDSSKAPARVQAGKDAILIPISPVMPVSSFASTSLSVPFSSALQSALGKGTVLRPVYVFGGSGTQLIQSGNIRLGVPVTISPTKASETFPSAFSPSAKKLLRPLQPRLSVVRSPAPTVTTAATTTTTTTTTTTVYREKASKGPLLSPVSDCPDKGGDVLVSKDDLMSIKAQILLLKEKRRQLRKTRSLLKRNMRRRRSSKSDVFSSSLSSNETSSSESAEFDSDMLTASGSDVEASNDDTSNHCYNTRLRARQNKLKFVRTSGNNWKVVHVSMPTSMYDGGDFDSEAEELKNEDFSDIKPSTARQVTPTSSSVAASKSCPMSEGLLSPSLSSSCTLKASVAPQNAQGVSSLGQGPKVAGQACLNTSTYSRPIPSQSISSAPHPNVSKACAKTVATTASLSCQQPIKTLTPPFNALLVKQPDGTFKLQILQPLTPANLTTSSSNILPNSSSLPSSIEISDTLITLSSTSLSILKGPIKDQESIGGTASTSITTSSCSTSPLVITSPFVIASPLKTHLEAEANRSAATAASCASQLTKISAATDQLRKMLQRKALLKANESTSQGSCAPLKLGDISDHVYAKSKPRRQRRRKASETKKRRARSGRRRVAERLKSETSQRESHLNTEQGQMNVTSPTDIDKTPKQDDFYNLNLSLSESSRNLHNDESDLQHESDLSDTSSNDVSAISSREGNDVPGDGFSLTSPVKSPSYLKESNDMEQIDGLKKSNDANNHVDYQCLGDYDTKLGGSHLDLGPEVETALKPLNRDPGSQGDRVLLSGSEHYHLTSKVADNLHSPTETHRVSDNKRGSSPPRIDLAPLKEEKTASSFGMNDTPSHRNLVDDSCSRERLLNFKVVDPPGEDLFQSRVGLRDSCSSSSESHPTIKPHDMTEVDLQDLVFGEENGFDVLEEALSTAELEEDWVP